MNTRENTACFDELETERPQDVAEYRELLLGCGNSRDKKVYNETDKGFKIRKDWRNLTTLDMDPDTDCDVVFDLNNCAIDMEALPFEDETFDEVHAYDVLEHVGMQGAFIPFFHEFGEYWRILKPGGLLCGTVPAWDSVWAWGDPGHTRVISEAVLVYLNQREYKLQVGKTAMTDYRAYWEKNFELIAAQYAEEGFGFVLQKG